MTNAESIAFTMVCLVPFGLLILLGAIPGWFGSRADIARMQGRKAEAAKQERRFGCTGALVIVFIVILFFVMGAAYMGPGLGA